jgi:hypothetical protein
MARRFAGQEFPGQIPADPNAPPGQLAVLCRHYDATQTPAEVKFYFGTPDQSATLDATVAYDRGPVGEDIGPLAVGHFNQPHAAPIIPTGCSAV